MRAGFWRALSPAARAPWGIAIGERELPRDVLGWGWGGLWCAGHGEQWAAASVGGGSDAPAAVGGDERAGELQWKVGILFLRPFWVEKGARRRPRRRRRPWWAAAPFQGTGELGLGLWERGVDRVR